MIPRLSWMSSPAGDLQDFPAPLDLAPEHSTGTTGLRTPSTFREQRRGLGSLEPRPDRLLQVREHRTALLNARRDHRPDPLAPAITRLAPRPLRDQAVDHHEPDRLLRLFRFEVRSRGFPGSLARLPSGVIIPV